MRLSSRLPRLATARRLPSLAAMLAIALLPSAPALAGDPPVTEHEQRYLKNVRQLTSEGEKSGEAYFSPDGKQIIFQSVRAGCPHYQIYVMNADGSDQRLVSTGKGKTTCAFFHPTKPGLFIYASTHLDESTWPPAKKTGRGYSWDFDGAMDVFLARVKDGKILKRLTTAAGYDAECSISPDGKQIVFTSTRDSGGKGADDGKGEIYLMDIDGSNQRRLTTAPGYDGGPFFSPDGKKILFRGFRTEMSATVFTIGLDGKNETALTRMPRINWAPFYHPSGELVVYAANTGTRHNFELFLVRADGSFKEVRLTSHEGFDGLPVFSPDGKKLLWTSNRVGKKSQVFVADFVMPKASEFKVQPAKLSEPAHGAGKEGYHSDKPKDKDAGANPHGSNPHGSNPHGATSRPTNPHGNSNPHGSNPHGNSNPHGTNPHGNSNPHGSNPHGNSNPHGTNPHGNSHPHGGATSRPAKDKKEAGSPHGLPGKRTDLPIIRGSVSGGSAALSMPGMALIDRERLLAHVKTLSDDKMEGRKAGTPGGRMAQDYIVGVFKDLGLEPAGDKGRFRHAFEFSAGTEVAAEGNGLVLRLAGKTAVLEQGEDWQPLLYSGSGVTGRVRLAFAGYGIKAPKQSYDDFAGLELAGKVAIVLTRGPKCGTGGAFGADRPTRHEDLRNKVGLARDAGAVGVLLVRSKGKGRLRLPGADAGIPVAQLEAGQARALLKGVGLDIDAVIAAIDEDGKPRSRSLEDAAAALSVKLDHKTRTGMNILAKLKGTDPKLSAEVVVIGAHYDHLGYGGAGSGSRSKEHAIHNGADDNASGTAGLFALARHFKAHPPKRSLVFFAFDAEESGLLGSTAWMKKPTVNKESIVAMFNMDMIGHLADNKALLVGGVGTGSGFAERVKKAAHIAGLDVAVDQDGQGPSDHSRFYAGGIPVLSFFTQTHELYHMPGDDWDTVDYEGMTKVLRMVAVLGREVANGPRPSFARVKAASGHGKPGRKRVATGEPLPWFGSIPDYAQSKELKGVRLTGARPGSPADKAGVQAGDIIVKFAGRSVANIYDYTYAIQGCAAGQEIEVVVRRGDETVTLKATLGSR